MLSMAWGVEDAGRGQGVKDVSRLQTQEEEGEDEVQENEKGINGVPLHPPFTAPAHRHRHHLPQSLPRVVSAFKLRF